MKILYDSQGYPVNTIAVDAVLFTIINAQLCVFVDKRKQEIGAGLFALPGRFVSIEYTPEEMIHEELKELGIAESIAYFEQLGVAGDPSRDPRKRIISINYFGIVAFDKSNVSQSKDNLVQGEFGWVEVNTIREEEMFADHFWIMNNARERLSNKMEYSLIAANFLDTKSFTANDIYQVYSIIWKQKLDLPNFRRKLLKNKNITAVSGKKTLSTIPKIAKTSQTYILIGDTEIVSTRSVLHPPILRK